MLYGVILAGGKGERFWPLSRAERPKQFLKLTSEKMMLEETIDRILPLIQLENIRIVTGEAMSGYALDNVSGITEDNLLTEPFGRNTCAAIGLAATHLAKEDPHAVLVALSADHLIRPQEKLIKILQEGAAIAASEDCLITIGITPTRPETGYGYIKVGERFDHQGECPVHTVAAFTEKPAALVAKEYYFSHAYLWNSGMFIWSAKSINKAIADHQPELNALLQEYAPSIGTPDEATARQALYEKAQSISIDFAVLEKATNVLTIQADIIWDDVGGWNALERYKEKDPDNNVLVGETLAVETYEATVYNDSDGIIACLGVSDLIVVRASNITMVVHKTQAAEMKKLLAKLGADEKTRQYL